MTEFRYMGELDLEWYAITEMFNENGNRVHVTLYESLKTNNKYFFLSQKRLVLQCNAMISVYTTGK